ncbi:hypothetical protein WJX72_007265 [[Myrmecia] bisecta]|uniref:F-box domain-containing protein n=1 Tax=[Myrmecia] bisecta TaxID=41462 RepID=A0AAW1QRG9_9CHLO
MTPSSLNFLSLPEALLGEICSHLDFADRVKLPLVCKHLALQLARASPVWREVTVSFQKLFPDDGPPASPEEVVLELLGSESARLGPLPHALSQLRRLEELAVTGLEMVPTDALAALPHLTRLQILGWEDASILTFAPDIGQLKHLPALWVDQPVVLSVPTLGHAAARHHVACPAHTRHEKKCGRWNARSQHAIEQLKDIFQKFPAPASGHERVVWV